MAPTSAILGVDFGTAESKAALVVGGRIRLVVDAGLSHVPSVVYVPPAGDLVVGESCRPFMAADPAGAVTSIKRLLGRRFSDPEVRTLDQGVGYRIVEGDDDAALVRVRGVDYSPVQLVAGILGRLRRLAEQHAGAAIDTAVLSMPVETAPGYEAALRRAAQIAGIRNTRFVSEPMAAAWGARLAPSRVTRRVLVCDFGGGTFDCSLLMQEGPTLDVVASAGDAFLGGDDLDLALADAIAGAVFRNTRADMRRDLVRWSELLWRCEKLKRELSKATVARLQMPGAFSAGGQVRDLDVNMQRAQAEPLWMPLIEGALNVARDALAAARWPVQLIDELVLVGGTSRVPIVHQTLARRLGKQPTPVEAADVAVAAGLAMMGATWAKAGYGDHAQQAW